VNALTVKGVYFRFVSEDGFRRRQRIAICEHCARGRKHAVRRGMDRGTIQWTDQLSGDPFLSITGRLNDKITSPDLPGAAPQLFITLSDD
jgi:hypothetical protein